MPAVYFVLKARCGVLSKKYRPFDFLLSSLSHFNFEAHSDEISPKKIENLAAG